MRIYLCPALMDWLIFLVHFAVLYAAGERALTIGRCAWLGGVFQVAYLCTSMAVGLVLTRARARAWLLASTAVSLVAAIACIFLVRYGWLLAAMGTFGVSSAVFFNSFQTFMRGESAPGGLARSVGWYTLAWSGGSGLGMLSAGLMYRSGLWALSGLSAGVCVVIFAVLLRHRTRPVGELSSDEHVEQGSAKARAVDPRYVRVAWVVIFTAMFMQRPIQNFFPALSARQGISASAAGIPLFLLMIVQGVSGAAFIRFRDCLYRRTPLWTMHAAGTAILLALWRWPSYWMSLVGIGALGIYTGFAYYSAVYYASNSGRRSFNIGINEFLVGVGSFAGLFVCEAWMRRSGSDQSLYLVCAAALAVSAVVQVALVSGRKRA